MVQGFTFPEAFQPPTQTDATGGFSFAEALGRQPEPAAPGTHVSPGGAAYASPKGIARKPQEPGLESEATSKAPASAANRQTHEDYWRERRANGLTPSQLTARRNSLPQFVATKSGTKPPSQNDFWQEQRANGLTQSKIREAMNSLPSLVAIKSSDPSSMKEVAEDSTVEVGMPQGPEPV